VSSILLSSNTQWVLLSTMILGIAAGTVGCIAYWKRQNLMSDALAHAALPGVVIAFLILGEKKLIILIIFIIEAFGKRTTLLMKRSDTANFYRIANAKQRII